MEFQGPALPKRNKSDIYICHMIEGIPTSRRIARLGFFEDALVEEEATRRSGSVGGLERSRKAPDIL